jgi:hypothetical protein
LSFLAAGDQAGPFEHPQMPRHRRHRHLERFGELADRKLAGHQTGEDRPAGWIRQGGEGGAQLVRLHAI